MAEKLVVPKVAPKAAWMADCSVANWVASKAVCWVACSVGS